MAAAAKDVSTPVHVARGYQGLISHVIGCVLKFRLHDTNALSIHKCEEGGPGSAIPWMGGVRELTRLERDACLESLVSLLMLTLCIPARSTVVGVQI